MMERQHPAEFFERQFQLRARGTTVAREARGAVATFLTMAYILVVNPSILSAAGVPHDSAIVCTAAAAAICCILMGLWANFPLATASGMGVNALVAYQIARSTGSWQTAMGLVVIDGVVVLLLVLAGFREAVMLAIPRDLRLAMGAGIGLFIAFIGLTKAGIVVKGPPDGPPVGPGSLRDAHAIVALIGLIVMIALMLWRVKGAILIGILVATIAGVPLLHVGVRSVHLAWPSFAA